MDKKITTLTLKEKKELLKISEWLGLNADEFNQLEKKFIEIINESKEGTSLYDDVYKLLENIVEELDDMILDLDIDIEESFHDSVEFELSVLKRCLEDLELPIDEIDEALDSLREKVKETCKTLPHEAVIDILKSTCFGLIEYYTNQKYL